MSIFYNFVNVDVIEAPSIIVDKRSDIVRYGVDNTYPQELLDLSIQSSLHSSILDTKIKLGVGDELSYEGENDLKTESYIEECNPFESLNDVFMKCYTDLEIFGGFSLELIPSKGGNLLSYHIPFQNLRSSKVNEFNQVEKYFYYDEWKKYTRYNDTEEKITMNKKNYSKQKTLMYAKKYSATNLYYPMPSYVGGIKDINTLHQISVFHNAAITNNFQPGLLIFFRGPVPSIEQQQEIVKGLKNKYSTAANVGTPGIFFLENDQNEPKIEQTPTSDLHKQFETLTKSVKESVVTAHSIPRIVANLAEAGSLGGSKEVIEANQSFMNNYVIKNQKFILSYFNKIMEINGLQPLKINNKKPNLLSYSENLVKEVLSKEEIRKEFGYDEKIIIVNE
jgi:hypothetical protein